MANEVKDLKAINIFFWCWIGCAWTPHKLNVVFIIRDRTFVDGIKGLKAYDSFKAVF